MAGPDLVHEPTRCDSPILATLCSLVLSVWAFDLMARQLHIVLGPIVAGSGLLLALVAIRSTGLRRVFAWFALLASIAMILLFLYAGARKLAG